MESDVYGFAMILWYLAARKTEPFLPLQKELAFAAIVEGKVSELPSIVHTLCYILVSKVCTGLTSCPVVVN